MWSTLWSNSVIPTPHLNSKSSVFSHQPGSDPTGPTVTVTLPRPPVPPAGSGATWNGRNKASRAGVVGAAGQAGTQRTPLVNNNLPATSVSVSVGSHTVKAEPSSTMIQSAQETVVIPSAPQIPAAVGDGPGGIQAMPPQMLCSVPTPTSTGQPGVRTLQLPPGMALLRSENGHLLVIPKQVLAQVQPQTQVQGGMVPQTAAPTSMSADQLADAPDIMPSLSGSSKCHHQPTSQGSSAPAVPAGPTTLHRPPLFQSLVRASVPGMIPRTISQTAGTTATLARVRKKITKNVKKCRSFLSTLIKLASIGNQSMALEATVKELVQDLLEGKLECEEFASKLYEALNASPQPFLVPFLKRSLPALRQLMPDSAAFILQSNPPKPAPVTAAASPSMAVLGTLAPPPTRPVSRSQLQPVVTNPTQASLLVVPCQQQRASLKPQTTFSRTPMVELRNQAPGRILVEQHLFHVKEGQEASLSAPKNKLNEAGGIFKDDEEINDVASMAGVNVTAERDHILATGSGLVRVLTRSCEDEAFLSRHVLEMRMLAIGRRYGVNQLGAEVMNLVSLATQQRLRNMLEKVSQVAQQRNTNLKEDWNHQRSSDVRTQLKFFQQLGQLEKQRKEEQEREILLKAAKSRARQDDPEQLRLKQKGKEMQQRELAQMRWRDTNQTALAAISPRKKRTFLDCSPAAAQGSESGPSLLCVAASSAPRPTRQRVTRVGLRDLLFCLQEEKFTSRSLLLYKGFLK